MSIAARLRRLEVRWPAPTPETPLEPMSPEEMSDRLDALMARVIDPDTGAVNPHASPDLLARWRRIEELFAAAEARRDAAHGEEQGRSA